MRIDEDSILCGKLWTTSINAILKSEDKWKVIEQLFKCLPVADSISLMFLNNHF
jgi:hypothetical protein